MRDQSQFLQAAMQAILLAHCCLVSGDSLTVSGVPLACRCVAPISAFVFTWGPLQMTVYIQTAPFHKDVS